MKITNLGRPITVDRVDGTERFDFAYRGEHVAELRPVPETGPGLVEWRLSFPDAHDAVLAAEPGVPPIGAALFFVDGALNRGAFEPMV